MSTPHRIPSLDGLRAISIGLVIFSHLAGTAHFFSERVGNFFALGELGVTVFFVISGYLITSLLLNELRQTGTISLPAFYLRRTFRIMPAYYVFLAGVLALASFGIVVINPGDITHAVTYTSNYHPGRAWSVGHTWSLAVEEQFYLLWPAVLLLAGARRGLGAALAFFCASPFIRLALWYWAPSISDGIGHRFETVADAIAIGCLLAGSATWLEQQRWYVRLLDSPLFVLVPALVLGANLLHDRPRLYFFFGMTTMNAGIALCLHWSVRHAAGRIGRLLNAPALVYVGVLSYSLYLWQQVFLNRASGAAINAFPVNLIFAISAALASYYLIERPALEWRQQFSARRRGRPTIPTSVALPGIPVGE